MKHLLLILVLAISVASCEKEEVKKHCPVVSAEQVPAQVAASFSEKYPGVQPINWFNKDGKGYGALISVNGVRKIASFDNTGNFVKEETELEQEGEHEDNSDDSECECSTVEEE